MKRALLGLLLMVALSSGAQPAVKHVLMLQSFNRGILHIDQFTGDFRVRLDQRGGKPSNVVQVVVGPTGFVGASDQALVDYIRSMYVDRPPDLIVTVAGPAAVFARKHRRDLFPGTPLLFASVDQRYLRGAPLVDNETAVAADNDFPRLVDEILRVLPETKQVFMVMGTGTISRFWRRELEAGFTRFRDRVTFIWSDDMSLEEILRSCASLPPHSAIFYLTFGTDAEGGAFADEQVLASLHARANAPLFGAFLPMLGYGIVGGSLLPNGDLARNAAAVANRILDGEAPESIRVPPQPPGQPTFDWRELRRWGIPESRLPPASVVKFRGPSLWDEYWAPAMTALGVLAVQSLLIMGLLYQRRARQRAEFDSRRNLALAADANRRETVSVLTASIGHELGQPISSIAHNAEVLRRMAAEFPPAPEVTGEILAEIQAEATLAKQIIERHRTMLRSHQLHKKPIDLHAVIDESLALVAHDLKARQIEAIFERPAAACLVDGDPVLLEQVLLNLVRNAMDALAGVLPPRRRITIRSEGRITDVQVSVCDTGTGLTEEVIDTLFTPFVSTKSHGLGIGLVIAHKIVDAHGGTLGARQNPDGGATFTVTLPRHATRNPANAARGD
jgi:signal transduction histidine kinase